MNNSIFPSLFYPHLSCIKTTSPLLHFNVVTYTPPSSIRLKQHLTNTLTPLFQTSSHKCANFHHRHFLGRRQSTKILFSATKEVPLMKTMFYEYKMNMVTMRYCPKTRHHKKKFYLPPHQPSHLFSVVW